MATREFEAAGQPALTAGATLTRLLRALAWTLCAVAWALGIGGIILLLLAGVRFADYVAGGHADVPVIALVGGALGSLIVQRRPRNPIGWLGIANALAQGFHSVANQYGFLALVHLHGALPAGELAAWLTTPSLVTAAATLGLELLLFPSGHPTSPRWRVLVYVLLGDLVVSLVLVGAGSWAVRGPGLLDGATAAPAGASPLMVGADIGRLLFALIGLLALISLFIRYRRCGGIERQQLKWYAFGYALTIGLLIAGQAIRGLAGGAIAAVSPVPGLVGIYVAMRRYHLYDIDRIVSRTVTYAALTAALALVYVTSATLLAWSIAPLTGGSTLTVAGSAVCAAALFLPLRRLLQDYSDRLFRRRSYEAGRVMASYLQGLQEREPMPGALRLAVAEALHDDGAEVGLWLRDRGEYVDEAGRPVVPGAGGAQVTWTRVDRRSEHLGILLHDRRLTETEPDVVASTVRAAAAALDHARLRAQVAAQLEEVRASRARIVAAGDAERRRLERDLHDGAQQRLLAAALALRRIEAHGPGADGKGAVGGVAAEVEAAIGELRELSHGLVPAILSEQGLAAAVQGLADRVTTPISVQAEGDERYAPAVETAAYYVVAEALTNVARHARARQVAVRVQRGEHGLEIEIADDGVGGATAAGGTGLLGLRDRVDAAGGSFELESRPGHGTRLNATLPLP